MRKPIDLQPDVPCEILTTAEMNAVDQRALAGGLSIDRLMLAAGEAVAEVVAAHLPPGDRIAVLCGPGNNGGDGYIAATVLAARGFVVEIFGTPLSDGTGAAARAAQKWRRAIRPLDAFASFVYDGVVDALFGAGLSRPLTGMAAEVIPGLNESGKLIFAVDVPSGLHGDTGQPLGPCVKADHTITFFRLKPAHLLWPGRGLCGAISVSDIGLRDEFFEAAGGFSLCHNRPSLWRSALPQADSAAHKYQRGHCLVLSGPVLRTGAARLAATAALNNGCGAVTIAGSCDALLVHAAHVTAILLQEAGKPEAFGALCREKKASAVILGPAAGIGEPTLAAIRSVIATAIPTVLDADALTSLIGRLDCLEGARAAMVMTPHEGEFDRLFAALLDGDAIYTALPAMLRTSKVEKARAAARISGAVIVFKGIDTVIAAPSGQAAINSNAGPELATAGSGDVLSGLIGAHLAQGMAAFEAACAAVWLHGRLGAQYGAGLTADRLVASVRPVSSVPDPGL